MTAPLLITADEFLRDEMLRLAAAAGVTPEVAADAAAALRGWSAASLVLLGADLADEVARTAPARRRGVHLVAWGAPAEDLYRLAVEVGAEAVLGLPRSEDWLVERLTDLEDSDRGEGIVVGVVGGSGGAGATTFGCALAQVAARRGPAVVVDVDPLGPGADRVLGLETREGVRWDALVRTTGRLSARSLREALPRRDGLSVLTWPAGSSEPVPAATAREALSALRRGHDTVVVDLPRTADTIVDDLAARCDLVLVVVVPSVAGVSAAARLCARMADTARLRVVVRGSGIDEEEVARVTGVPVLARMADQRGLAEALDLGLGPVRTDRGALGRTSTAVLARLAVGRVAA